MTSEQNRDQTKEVLKEQEEHSKLKFAISQVKIIIIKINDSSNLLNQSFKYEILSECEQNLSNETTNQTIFKIHTELAHDEFKLLNKINKNINVITDNVLKTSKEENNSIDDILLKKYNTLSILSGIKITDSVPDNYNYWYNIIFSNLPDECLEFEKNSNLSHLSSTMVDRYKPIFEVSIF